MSNPMRSAGNGPFIQKNIDATLRAYNIHQVETREEPVSDEPEKPKKQNRRQLSEYSRLG